MFCLWLTTLNRFKYITHHFGLAIRRLTAQHDRALRYSNRAAAFEIPKRARDCLKRKSEIIRNMPAVHRQVDSIR